MLRITYLLSILFLSLLVSPLVWAKPEAKLSLSSPSTNIPNPVTYSLEVEWPKDEAKYSFALPPLDLKHLELIQQGESEETFVRSGAAWTRKTFSFSFRPTKDGEGMVQEFLLPYIDPNNQKAGNLTIPRTTITIFPKPANNPILLIVLLSLGASILLGFLITRIRRNRLEAGEESTPVTFESRALQEFDGIQATGKHSRDITLQMGRTFRKFLAEAYELRDANNITEEALVKRIKDKESSVEMAQTAEKLLKQLNDLKFMGVAMDKNEQKTLQDEMINFVNGKKVVESTNS